MGFGGKIFDTFLSRLLVDYKEIRIESGRASARDNEKLIPELIRAGFGQFESCCRKMTGTSATPGVGEV